jgi:hypothetical protein
LKDLPEPARSLFYNEEKALAFEKETAEKMAKKKADRQTTLTGANEKWREKHCAVVNGKVYAFETDPNWFSISFTVHAVTSDDVVIGRNYIIETDETHRAQTINREILKNNSGANIPSLGSGFKMIALKNFSNEKPVVDTRQKCTAMKVGAYTYIPDQPIELWDCGVAYTSTNAAVANIDMSPGSAMKEIKVSR